MKITKDEFTKLMSHYNEIDFRIENDPVYTRCCMGKMPDRDDNQKDCYWYGLTPDGTQAYDYHSLQKLCHAPVFDGQSLFDLWDRVEFCSLDACPFEERIGVYLK